MNKDGIMKDIEKILFYQGWNNGPPLVMNEFDRHQAAFIKLFLPGYDTRGIAAFDSLRDAYIRLTGDSDISGMFRPKNVSEGLRASMDFSSTTFSYALQNALSMYLAKSYKEFPFHEEVLISEKKTAKDFRKIHSIQLGYLGDLPDVDPEAGDYDSMEQYGDTESQYDLSHKGAILWVTRRHVINDSIELIQGMTKRMARAARKAHARYVWDFFIDNALCPDGAAWFTGGHGNLGTDALSISSLVVAVTVLADMTEPGPSAEKIGLDLGTFNWSLVIPIVLWNTAVGINQTKYYYTSNDLTTKTPNPCYRLFGDHNERIVISPFMSDTNDWGVIRDKEDVPIIEMSYYAGQEDPEFIIETGPDPRHEHVFKGDKLGYKIRHEYGGTLAEYRGGYKASVT